MSKVTKPRMPAVYCSVKKPKQCPGLGYFIFIDRSGGEMVLCQEHFEQQQNIELIHQLKEDRKKGVGQ